MNMQERINELGITINSTFIGELTTPAWGTHYSWTVVLQRSGSHSMLVPWHQGLNHRHFNKRTNRYDPNPPEAKDVLTALASDAATWENSRSFDEWARDLGFDPDSRKAEKLYRQVEDQVMELRTLLGEHYDAVLWETDHE